MNGEHDAKSCTRRAKLFEHAHESGRPETHSTMFFRYIETEIPKISTFFNQVSGCSLFFVKLLGTRVAIRKRVSLVLHRQTQRANLTGSRDHFFNRSQMLVLLLLSVQNFPVRLLQLIVVFLHLRFVMKFKTKVWVHILEPL